MAGKPGRRGNGEGNIRKRANGAWEGRYVASDGKCHSVYAPTRTEVARKLAAALRDRDHGVSVMTERPTLAAYLTQWLETRRPPVLAAATWRGYESICRVHVVPRLGTIRLAQLTPLHIQRVLSDALAAGRSSTTAHHVHTCLHTALEEAVRMNLLQRNPAAQVHPPPIQTTARRTFSREQVQTLLVAAKGDRLEALYVLALATGMRQGELLGLRWRDVDLEAASLHIQSALHRALDGRWELGRPKSEHSRRTLLLTPQTVEALRAHRARQVAERLALGPAWEAHDLVFCAPSGAPVRPDHLERYQFLPLLVRAGLPRIRFHDLRHTCATLLIAAGVPVTAVADLLGHGDASITLRVYAHVTPGMQHQARDAMARVLGEG